MAGRRHKDFRSGDLNEELGVLLLKGLAAVASVPRPEDVGIDAIATLLRDGPNDMLIAEDSFYVQFKSAGDRKVRYVDHEVRWLESLKLPFFLASIRKQDSAIDLYATHGLSKVILEGAYSEINLFLDSEPREPADLQKRSVFVGPPLISWSTLDLARAEFGPWAYSILKPYLEAEQRNIVYRGIRYIEIISWVTGKPPRCQEGSMLIQSTVSNDDVLRALRDMTPHLLAVANHAMSRRDRHAMEICIEMINHMRDIGFDPDPRRTHQALLSHLDWGESQ
jgi:hypothetical protein